jgi:hypothetical protein
LQEFEHVCSKVRSECFCPCLECVVESSEH